MPGVFMRPERFEERMHYLWAKGYPVLDLEEALDLLDKDRLPNRATVITMDDGWYSIKDKAHKICKKYQLPYTVYISSYHCLKRSPVFNMFVRYLFWKTEGKKLSTQEITGDQSRTVDLTNSEERAHLVEKVIQYGHIQLSEEERENLLNILSDQLGVDGESIRMKRIFDLMTSKEIGDLSNDGVDIQLHTHRHRFPVDKETVKKEIRDNRRFLEPIIKKQLHHFCYPSGFYDKVQFDWLQELDIRSATTTRSGFNDYHSNRMELNRFLDFDNYDQLLFEAELSGILELGRQLRQRVQF